VGQAQAVQALLVQVQALLVQVQVAQAQVKVQAQVAVHPQAQSLHQVALKAQAQVVQVSQNHVLLILMMNLQEMMVIYLILIDGILSKMIMDIYLFKIIF
jgi:hypothetical protein